MDADHNLFSGQWSRSDHFPVVATLETATARKSTGHELEIDNSLYADPKVRKIINQLWGAIYKDYNPYTTPPPSSTATHTPIPKPKMRLPSLCDNLQERKNSASFPLPKLEQK
eukprot:scaffold29678_cov167-Isochrysis_galbana.AAC.1